MHVGFVLQLRDLVARDDGPDIREHAICSHIPQFWWAGVVIFEKLNLLRIVVNMALLTPNVFYLS